MPCEPEPPLSVNFALWNPLMPTRQQITCLIPTHNRPLFLRRLLHFYQLFPPGFTFVVIDSSHSEAAAENVDIIKGVSTSLNIGYRHLDLNVIDKCAEGLRNVTTPLVVFCADDDFLMPDAIWQCVDFLENHPEYGSAIGRMAATNVMQSFSPCIVHQGYSIEDDRPFDRCRKIADFWFTNFYGVHRTESLSENFRLTAASTDSRKTPHLAEQMLSLLSVLSGRVKVLPLISSVVECHGKNSSMTTRSGMQAEGEELYLRFRNCVATQLELTGIDRVEAERFLDQSYGHFRDSNIANRKRRRSIVEHARRFAMKASHLALDYLGRNHNQPIPIKRLLRASDYATSGPCLRQAQQLIWDFPHGMSADSQTQKRCA